jgi:hypothetical protein
MNFLWSFCRFWQVINLVKKDQLSLKSCVDLFFLNFEFRCLRLLSCNARYKTCMSNPVPSVVRNTIFRKALPSVVSGYGKRLINLNKVVATFEKHIFLSQTDLTRTGIISNSYNWQTCVSAELQRGPIRHNGAKKKLQLKHKNSLFTLQTFHYNYYWWSQSLLNRFGRSYIIAARSLLQTYLLDALTEII